MKRTTQKKSELLKKHENLYGLKRGFNPPPSTTLHLFQIGLFCSNSLAIHREIISFLVLRTVYSRIQVRIMLVKGYPDKTPIVELSSKTLPPPLLRSKEKECLAVAKTLLGKAQVGAIFHLLYDFVQENMFVPCWKEVKKLAAMCEGSEHDHKFGCDEETGVVQLRLRNGAYRQSINLIVPKNYPEDAVSVEILAGNLPNSIMNIYKGHADDVARRCIAGFTPEDALATVHEVDAGHSQRTVSTRASLRASLHDKPRHIEVVTRLR